MLSRIGLDYVLYLIIVIHLLLIRGLVPGIHAVLAYSVGTPLWWISAPVFLTNGLVAIATLIVSTVVVTIIYAKMSGLLVTLMRFASKDKMPETARELQYHQLDYESETDFRCRMYYLAIFREPSMLYLTYMFIMACSMFPYVLVNGYTPYMLLTDISAVFALFWIKSKVEQAHSEYRANLYR